MKQKFSPIRAQQAFPLLMSMLAVLIMVLTCIAACAEDSAVQQPTLPPVASESVVVTPSSPVPNDDPSIRGFVTRITNSAESTEILVEYFPEEGQPSAYPVDKVLVKLDANTAMDSDNGTIIDVSSLTVGSTVEVWFSDPSEESYPALAYGHAIRLITSGDAMNGMRALPHLAVIGSSKSLAGVTEAKWPHRNYDYSTTLSKMLEDMRGAHVTASPGKVLTLSFSSQPKNCSVKWTESNNFYSVKKELEVGENNEIIIPEDANGEIFVYVEAAWERGSMVYGFSVSIVEQN